MLQVGFPYWSNLPPTPHLGKTSTQQDVCDVLTSLQYALEESKSKPVEVLRMATEISSSLNALRLTSCKSAKDRTGMAVSLEQARWLSVGPLPNAFLKQLKYSDLRDRHKTSRFGHFDWFTTPLVGM